MSKLDAASCKVCAADESPDLILRRCDNCGGLACPAHYDVVPVGVDGEFAACHQCDPPPAPQRAKRRLRGGLA